MSYMERLLAHYTGKSTLDAETLKTLAESVEKMKSPAGRPRTGPEGTVTGAGGGPGAGAEADVTMEPDVGAEAEVQSHSSDSFKVDEITVQPLENNITRKAGPIPFPSPLPFLALTFPLPRDRFPGPSTVSALASRRTSPCRPPC